MPPRRRKTAEELSVPVGDSLLSPLDVNRMRLRMGLYLRELADRIGVARRLVDYWESGKRPISDAHAAKLHTLHKESMEKEYPALRKNDPRKRLCR